MIFRKYVLYLTVFTVLSALTRKGYPGFTFINIPNLKTQYIYQLSYLNRYLPIKLLQLIH